MMAATKDSKIAAAADVEKSTASDDINVVGETHAHIDGKAQQSYVRKLDFYLLPFLSLMYLFNSVDRVRYYFYFA